MKRVLQMWLLALAVLVGVSADARPSAQEGTPRSHGEMSSRLSRRGSFGRINIQGGKKHFPEGAEVSIERKRPDDVKRKIHQGWSKRKGFGSKRGPAGGSGVSPLQAPSVLASYDISIRHGGRKWQPDAGDPVRVDVELDAPVPVTDASSLGVVHLADDGTVEKLDASRYGFTYNKEKTAVTAFWFSAEGFSVYAITEGAVHTTDSDPARRLYDFYSLDFNKFLEDGVTSNTTYNTYVPRYFKTLEGNYTFRQIVTNNQFLVRPEALPSPLGRTFMGWYLYSTNNANKTVDGITYDADGYATTPFDFEAPVVFNDGETGEHEYVLRSQFDRVGYVIFHEQPVSGVWPITAVRRGIMTEIEPGVMQTSVDISDLKVTYDDTQDEGSTHENTTPRMIFRGWSTNQVMPGASMDVNGNTIKIEESPFTFTRQKDTEATPRHLFPVFVNINWLTFKAAPTGEGATYIPPRFYYADEGTNAFPVPLRTGYTFNGWWTTSNDVAGVTGVRVSNNDGSLYTSANLSDWDGHISGGNLMLDANVTLYGRWTAAPTRYTVVIWQQKATDAANLAEGEKTYDFAESFTNTALAESSIGVDQKYKNWSGQAANSVHEANYTGFTYARCDDAVTINGNGSSVLNVYYDRNEHTLTFNNTYAWFTYNNRAYRVTIGNAAGSSTLATLESNKKTNNGYEVSYNGSTYYIKIAGTWYQVSTTGYRNNSSYSNSTSYRAYIYQDSAVVEAIPFSSSFTALYGSSIKHYFPIDGTEGFVWDDTGSTYSFILATLETMPDANVTFTGEYRGSPKTINYYVEVDSDDGYDTAFGGLYYKFYKVVKHDFTYITFNEEFHPIEGYTQSYSSANPAFSYNSSRGGYTADIGSGNVNDLYYVRRADLSVTFFDSYDNEVLDEKQEIKFNAKLADVVPDDPESTRPGYLFTGWYTDSACSTRVFFKNDEAYASYRYGKVLIERMPAYNLRVFAGWETEWYLIQIDPNGGQLADGQSLWFWEAYDGDPIEEYSTVTRSFEENVNGTYFYAVEDRAYYGYSDEWVSGEAANRRAFYTTDQSAAIRDIDKRYTPVINAYRYAGWYEVMPDGTEELYAFGEPVKRNTTLKLHWKHLGTYRLHYEPGDGEMVERDENEETFKLLDSGIYADSAELLVTRTAEPPEGYSFAGWRIRYGDGTVYHPGQSFIFNAAYAVNVPGPDGRPVKQLILDAVYSQVRTVSLTTDANGGTIDPTTAVTLPLAYPNAPTLITNITDTTRTVSGMRNNAYGHLSNGDGYTCVVKDAEGNDVELDFLGWNTRADGTGTHFAPGQYVGVDTLDAPDGANVLYAEWAVPVYFDKNNEDIAWSHDLWTAKWGDKYVFDADRNQYVQTTTLNGYATFPEIVRDSSTANKMFAFWSTARYKDWEDCPEFDFENTPITGPTVLYAIWKDFIEVPFHPVDASGATPVVREDWFREVSPGVTNKVIRVGNETNVAFDDDHADYVTATGCIYSYACLADSVEHISEKARISRLYYDQDARATYVEYPDGTTGPIPSDKELYFVYFTGDTPLDIGYRVMGQNATFEAKTPANNGPTSATIGTEATNMASFVIAPNTYVTGHDHYAFAIGETNATSAAQLRIITPVKERDNDRPQLQIRNTWRGIEYSLDGGTTWGHYGHNAQLYVLYFDSTPTIVNLAERTIGTEDDMTNKFEYVVIVSNVTITVEQRRTMQITGGRTGNNYSNRPRHYRIDSTDYHFQNDWEQVGNVTSTGGDPVPAGTLSTVTNFLVNGTADSVTLLASDQTPVGWTDGTITLYSGNGSKNNPATLRQTQTKTIITNLQMVVIIQRPVGGFATSNDTGDGEYVYTQTSAATNATYGVTYTNTHESLPVELHVAFAQNAAIDHVDNAWRTLTEADYTLTVPLSVEGTFEDALVKTNVILKAAAADRRFIGAYYGKPVETNLVDENKVSLVGPVTSVGFVKHPTADWYRLCLNGDANLALGDYKVYYVYGEIPTVRYMKEGANGALTEIATLTYVGNPVTMNGATVAQGTVLDVPAGGTPLTVGAGGTADFYVPLSLDGSAQASLNYYALAAGPADATTTNAMSAVTWGTSLRVKVAENGLLKWSLDGETWGDFTGTAASIYAIYKEKGYDLTIAVDSLASDADKAKDVFTVTVASINLVVGNDYVVSGYAPDGTPIDTVKATACDEGGMLTFTVTSGVRFTIQSLPNNEWPDSNAPMGMTVKDYTLRELLPSSDYALTNLLVNGAVPLAQVQVENGTATFMDMNKTVEFTNIKSYTVTFVDEDGTEISSDKVPYGTTPDELTSGVDDPAKPMDATSIYRFDAWGPTLEPVGSNTTYTAEYKEIKIPQATQRAANTNIVVTLSEEEAQAREAALVEVLKSVGVDITADDYSETDATEKLNARDPNGLRRWENLVTGTATDQLLLNTVSGNSATISAKMVADPDASVKKDLGYTVLRELRKKGDGDAWRTVAGPFEAGNPSFDIALADGEGNSVNASGLYRLVTLIVPKCDLSITNEIPSTNIIGVLEVKSTNVNTIVAVPWKELASDPFLAADVTVSNHVSAVNLTDGDSVYALKDGNTYEMWTLNKGKWESVITVSTASDANYSMVTTATDADKKTFSRGNAVWVTRKNPTDGATAKPFFLVGQYDPAGVTIAVAGGSKTAPACTQIAIPDYTGSVGINDLDWGGNPISTDLITIPNGATTTILRWVNGKWGEYKQVYNEALGRNRNTFVPYTDPIPVGTGFWYSRRGGAFTVTWQPSETVK